MEDRPIFTALATSTKQLYLLLRCIAFGSKADVYIVPEGLRFTTEESHAIQASTLLEKSLFSSYMLRLPEDYTSIPAFQINITALLETLQIFGISETSLAYKNQNGGISSSYATAFNTPALGLGGTCKISYTQIGAPLSIMIEENGVKTTCEMNTYELPDAYDEDTEIPLDRNALVMKIIMSSTWLYDAITELSSTSPEVLLVNASSISAPYFALEGHGGPFGDSTVDFLPELKADALSSSNKPRKQPQITETFTVAAPSGSHGRIKQSYKFDLIKKAGKAMQLASKVSIRQDRQGVMSFQFMIETADPGSGATENTGTLAGTGAGRFSFIDFRFVPLLDMDGGDGDEDAGDGASTQSDC